MKRLSAVCAALAVYAALGVWRGNAAAPPTVTRELVIPVSSTECRSRALQAFATEGYTTVRDFGTRLVGATAARSAVVACVPVPDSATVLIVVAGDEPNVAPRERIAALMRGPATADMSGKWQSTAWGTFTLQQSGHVVTGSYSCCGVGAVDGAISGTTIRFSWKNGGQSIDRGEATMTLKADGTVEGNWCSGVDCDPAGKNPYVARRP